jgi:hypothetical protein
MIQFIQLKILITRLYTTQQLAVGQKRHNSELSSGLVRMENANMSEIFFRTGQGEDGNTNKE